MHKLLQILVLATRILAIPTGGPIPVSSSGPTPSISSALAEFHAVLTSSSYGALRKNLQAVSTVQFSIPGSSAVAAAFAKTASTSGVSPADAAVVAQAQQCINTIIGSGALPVGASCVSSGKTISFYKNTYLSNIDDLGVALPEPVVIILNTTIAAYLLPLTYVPNINELFGEIDSIILATAQTFLGVGVTASSILGSYPAYVAPAPSTGNLATLKSDSFYWGVSMSAYQNEGHSVDSNWERFIATGSTTEGQVLEPYTTSADFWTRHTEDVGLAAGMGLNMFRSGVAWARLETAPGVWNQTAMDVYIEIAREITDAGMTLMETIDHWTIPGWTLDDFGGWKSDEMVTRWLVFAKKVVDALEDAKLKTPVWYLTFNEAVFYAIVEQKLNDITPNDVVPMIDRIVACHLELYRYIHAKRSTAMVSSNLAFIPLGAQEASDALFFDQIAHAVDFIGIDYYYGATPEDPYSCVYALTPTPWLALLEPEGLYYALEFYAKKYPNIPLYVTENGMSTENLQPRADGYLRENLIQDSVYWLQRAVADGMNVLGFNVWTLTDNYEWSTWTPRLGLYSVDIVTDKNLTRVATAGVATFKGIAARGGVVEGYKPSRGPDTCSLVNPPWSCSNPVVVAK